MEIPPSDCPESLMYDVHTDDHDACVRVVFSSWRREVVLDFESRGSAVYLLPVSSEPSAERGCGWVWKGFRTQRSVWEVVRDIRNLRTGGCGRGDEKLTVRIDWLDEGVWSSLQCNVDVTVGRGGLREGDDARRLFFQAFSLGTFRCFIVFVKLWICYVPELRICGHFTCSGNLEELSEGLSGSATTIT